MNYEIGHFHLYHRLAEIMFSPICLIAQ